MAYFSMTIIQLDMKKNNTIKITKGRIQYNVSFTDNYLIDAKYCFVRTFEDYFTVSTAMPSYEGTKNLIIRQGNSVFFKMSIFKNEIQTGEYDIDTDESDNDEIIVYYEDIL